ncbi:amino acid ABC transporter permease [Pararhizobium haloflavum]|uniref:amino acid ABC transporter permease n=1 Tax=Pararhizobium haloflavum TaxID=2037914 RepID=UPI000C17AA55|nr:amino acid ABC transporter permease [Pararhizobium haloflavum]
MDFALIAKVWTFFAAAAWVTLQISALAICLGLCLGFAAALASISRNVLLRFPARVYVSIFRGTPALIQLFLLYYGGPQIGLQLGPFEAGVIGLGINIGAYMTESIRGAILAVEKGQMEAARCLGLGHVQSMRNVILPQALRLMVRPLGVNAVALIKGSAIVSTISVVELTYTAHRYISSTYKPFEMFILASLFYLVIVSVVSFAVNRIDERVALES